MGKQKPQILAGTVFVLVCSDSKRNSNNSVHTNLVKFWRQSSVIHRFVFKNTTEQSTSILLDPWQQSLVQSPQGFKKFNGWRWSLFAHNNCTTCWLFPYCLCRFQGKGQRLVWRLQINCIAAGLVVSQLPDRGTENFVPPPSEGIHEIWPSWYLSWCWSSFWTLRLQVCWCNVPDMHSIYCMEMKPAVVTVVRDVYAADEGKVDSKK